MLTLFKLICALNTLFQIEVAFISSTDFPKGLNKHARKILVESLLLTRLLLGLKSLYSFISASFLILLPLSFFKNIAKSARDILEKRELPVD